LAFRHLGYPWEEEKIRMKLLLINPTVHRQLEKRITPFWLPPLGLASLGGLTPEEWETSLLDENVEDIDFDQKADLVAISCMTANSERAYHLARHFKKGGSPIVLGGPHITMLPEEGLQVADSVVIGDAETVWPQILTDSAEGRLQKKYNAFEREGALDTFSQPRRSLYKKTRILVLTAYKLREAVRFDALFAASIRGTTADTAGNLCPMSCARSKCWVTGICRSFSWTTTCW
jgi:radical SAM superfamily enzyme YgiQ (UPF0313 family)